MKTFLTWATSCFLLFSLSAQTALQPGFDKSEYVELLKISARQVDTPWVNLGTPNPAFHKFVYRSPVIGIDNQWDLWLNTQGNGGPAVLSIRGTTADATSWLANFYAAMVPAKGTLHLADHFTFDYRLAEDPKAAVHVGWLIATAYIARDMLPKIDSCYRQGIRDFVIMGHSQGGAIAFLLTPHLYELQRKGRLPADIRFKTYCSAAPKPGNLYFAYEYEYLTRGGWACNVVNAADWVPETPISIQTADDFNTVNPFSNAKQAIRKQKFPQRLLLGHVYKKLTKPTFKARRNYKKYLGKQTYKLVKKHLQDLKQPEYFNSNYYARAGQTIILMPDEDYYKRFPDNPKTLFIHHFPEPYLYLAERYR